MRKVYFRCDACGWRGLEEEILTAPNPFNTDDEISGCPKCGSVGEFTNMCDEPGCDSPASCGFPAADGGYRRTCGRHWAEAEKQDAAR